MKRLAMIVALEFVVEDEIGIAVVQSAIAKAIDGYFTPEHTPPIAIESYQFMVEQDLRTGETNVHGKPLTGDVLDFKRPTETSEDT